MNFFATFDPDEGTYLLTTAGYTALAILALALLLLASFIGGKKREKKGKSDFSTRQLVFCSTALALGVITSMIKFWEMPMGGSVTLFSMLFISLIGYWYGVRIGLITAIAYGVLQLILNPYIISAPQLIFDYIFAFGALGLSGLFSNKKNGLVKGYLLAVLGRYLFAFLSGVIFFGMWAPESFTFFEKFTIPLNPYTYSLLYNGMYLAAEVILTIVFISLPHVKSAMVRVRTMAINETSTNS